MHWNEGIRRSPTWERDRRGWLDTAGVHALVREAELPMVELRNMGWNGHMLSYAAAAFIDPERVRDPLGRIALDTHYNITGECWPAHADLVPQLGQQLIDNWFNQ